MHSTAIAFLCGTFLLLVIATAGAASEVPVHDNITFDSGVLSRRGVDPSIAELFRHAPRFLPGESNVTLTVNGSTRGQVKVRFNEGGILCAGQAFQYQAGLISPPGYDNSIACFDLRRAWPQVNVQSDPSAGKVHLVVPTDALSAPEAGSRKPQLATWRHAQLQRPDSGFIQCEQQVQLCAVKE